MLQFWYSLIQKIVNTEDTFYLLKITLFISQPRFNTNLQPKKTQMTCGQKKLHP